MRIIFFFLFTVSLSGYSNTFQVTNDKFGKQIGQQISFLKELNKLSFEEIRKSDKFIKSEVNVPNYGMYEGDVWIKLKLENKSTEKELILRLAYPILDEVTFYFTNESGGWDSVSYTEKTALIEREFSEPSYAHSLSLPIGLSKTYFIKVTSSEQIIVPISIHSNKTYWKETRQDVGVNSFYAGVVAIMIIYNLFVFYSVKGRSYIYYVLYLLFVGLTQLGIKGAIPINLLSHIPGFHDFSLVLFGSLGALFGVVFTRDFLQTKLNLVKIDLVLKVTIPIFIVASILAIIGFRTLGFQLMQLGTSISALTILIASILAIRKGIPSAKYFTLAWSTILFGAIIFLLKDVGLLPYNVFTNYSMQAASAFEMALLSFALADKINILQVETKTSREREVVALKRNEKLIKEQNIFLEQKVEERTHDLKDANESLSDAMSTLKNAQSQLVSQEKMASLGQLTAGIAHEINNPINFVSSNVSPLRLDIQDLKDIIDKYDELTGGEQYVEVKEVLDKLKNEVDYTYVLSEINQLLDGIQEGADRTAEIVKSLKNFSRLDEIASKFASIHDGIDSTIVILKSGTKGKVDIIKHYDEKIEPIECYPGKMNQVFSNILVNGIQALTDEKSPTENPQIVITTKDLGKNISISIKDNGPGIPDEIKENIFDPFFTTKDVGEGTGLGLSIVFSIIESHHGSIDVNSIAGEGTEFLITLPKAIH